MNPVGRNSKIFKQMDSTKDGCRFFNTKTRIREEFTAVLSRISPAWATRFHYGAERQESGEEKAGRIVGEELKRRRWTETSLAGRRKSDPEKVKIALRLRRESIMTLKWIAERLWMGTWMHLNHLLYWHQRRTLR